MFKLSKSTLQTECHGLIYVTNTSNVTDKAIRQYIVKQGHETPEGDFKIDGDDI